MRGQKRKLPPELPDESALAWESQREFVFSISLSKYQHGQELPEPSLRRSVLIANTLRQISLDGAPPPSPYTGRQDGSVSRDGPPPEVADGPASLRRPPFAPEGASSGMSALHFGPDAAPSPQEEGEDWESMSADPDFSLSAAISSILSALDSTIDGVPQAAGRTPLRSLENLSWSSEGGLPSNKQGPRGAGRSPEQQQEECRLRDGGVEAMRSCYLGDLTVEDLFQDIDTSLLERDMGILGLRAGGGGQQQGEDLLRYLPPFPSASSPAQPPSLPFNQNVRCLPSFSSFSPSSFPAFPHPLTSAPPPSFATQGMRDSPELDHLMEILVES